MNNNLRYFWPAVLWAIFIFTICNIELKSTGGPSIFFEGFDKFTHCGLFFVLTIFYCNGFLRKHRLKALSALQAVLIIVMMIAYGGIIELVQQYIFTWRSGDLADLFADGVGTCMGIFSTVLITSAVKRI